jgi:hypothetical protein
MKNKLFILFIVLYSFSNGQNISSYQVKEQYDAINNNIVNLQDIKNLNVNNFNGDFLGDGVSYFLSSIEMWFTTRIFQLKTI